MPDEEYSGSSRFIDIMIGILLIVLSGSVYLLTEAWLALMVIILGVALFLFGVSRIFRGYIETFQPLWHRVVNAIFGLIFIITAILAIIYLPLGGLLWAIILTIALMVLGITLLITGIFGVVYPTWHRVFVVIIGVSIFALGIYIIIQPTAALFILALILATGLLLAGTYFIVLGIVGRQIIRE